MVGVQLAGSRETPPDSSVFITQCKQKSELVEGQQKQVKSENSKSKSWNEATVIRDEQ